ncbi:hypothetical protein [Methylobacterium pseudosasicola]|uniref:hypothetical protein n=1 Tax=Methylobacterium pseudosasicola TaxID=582667 RepID=UPI0014289110|nr:hypothetical protein [Methylobacterium pseudosasicola]
MSTFFGASSDPTTAHDLEDEAEAYLLRLVASYLREAEPEARCRFAASVEALLQADSQ